MKNYLLLMGALIGCTAQAATVGVESDFLGGVFGTFSVRYETGSPGVKLQKVQVNLQAPLYTDPTWTAPGALLPFPFLQLFGASQTGFVGTTGISDGATSFALLFDDFDPGETFGFELDVDQPCGHLFCQGGASWITASEFAGSVVTATFGGEGYQTTDLSAAFVKTGELTARAQIGGEVATPEPASFALIGLGLCGLGVIRRRRSA